MTTPDKPYAFGSPWLGLSNRRRAFELHDQAKGGDFLATAENVNITNAGNAKRRRGQARAIAGTNCHSLFADGTDVFYADGPTMYRLVGQQMAQVVLRSNLPAGHPLSFDHDGINRIYTDGVVVERIVGNTTIPIAPPRLVSEPTAVGSSGGALAAGFYQFAWCFRDSAGREGPCTTKQQVSVPAGGKIVFSGLPSVLPTGASAMVLYLSPLNGTTLLRAVTTSATSTYTLPVAPTGAAQCQTELLQPIPAGQLLRFVNGRLHVANGNILYYSRPYAPGLYDPSRDYIPFPDPITMIETVPNAIYVATSDQTYFIAGDIAQAELKPLLPYGATGRASARMPEKHSCTWMSTRGVCVGDATGNVNNLQEAEVFVDPAPLGALLVREQDGIRQVIAPTFGATPAATSVGSFMTATVS